jgi:chromosome segregation ATPase
MRNRRKKGFEGDSFGMPLADLLTTALGCILMIFMASSSMMKEAVLSGIKDKNAVEDKLLTAEEKKKRLEQAQDAFRKELEALKNALANANQSLNKSNQALSETQEKVKAKEQEAISLSDQLKEAKILISQTQGELIEISGVTKEAIKRLDPRTAKAVDIMLVIDGTKSMQPSLDATRQNLRTTISALRIVSPSARIGVAVFRDKLDTDAMKLQYHQLTNKAEDLESFLSTIQAISSKKDKDRPEWICGGIKKAVDANWRKDVIQLIVVVSDAGSQESVEKTCVQYATQFHKNGGKIHVLSTIPDGYEKISTVRKEYDDIVLKEHQKIAQAGGGQHIKNAQGSTLLEEVLKAAYQERMHQSVEAMETLEENLKENLKSIEKIGGQQ